MKKRINVSRMRRWASKSSAAVAGVALLGIVPEGYAGAGGPGGGPPCRENITVPTDPGQCEVATVDPFEILLFNPQDVTNVTITPGPYQLGDNAVTVTWEDAILGGVAESCDAIITVVDFELPTVGCVEGTNPSGRNTPKAGKNPKSGQNPDGFYKLLASDNCPGVLEIFVMDPVSGFVAGPYQSGDQVKITQSPGGKAGVKPGPGVIVEKIRVQGDPIVMVRDGAGNLAETGCFVPPPPK